MNKIESSPIFSTLSVGKHRVKYVSTVDATRNLHRKLQGHCEGNISCKMFVPLRRYTESLAKINPSRDRHKLRRWYRCYLHWRVFSQNICGIVIIVQFEDLVQDWEMRDHVLC